MIHLNIDETEKLAVIVAALVKLDVNVTAEMSGGKWRIEVTK